MRFFCVIGILISGSLYGQRPKLHEVVDSSELVLSNYTETGAGGGGQEVDPEDIDFELLNALVFEKVNAFREKRHLRVLEYDTAVDKMAWFNSTYGSNSTFENSLKARHKFSRELKRSKRFITLPYGICKTGMSQRFAMKYTRKQPYFYYDEVGDLIYGGRGEVQDESFEIKPVEHYTYEELADQLFQDLMKANKREMMSKYHKVMSVRTVYHVRTKKENRIPIIRTSIVYGAPRLSVLK